MSKHTLKLSDTEVNKKDFYASKKAIPLNLVNTKNIIISYKVKHNDDSYKYFIGYSHDDVIRQLCIILPQMSGYIKYFDNGGKNMSFKMEDESVYIKYSEIWNKIKIMLIFSGDEIPKEIIHYVCIAAICIDSVLRTDKKIIIKFI